MNTSFWLIWNDGHWSSSAIKLVKTEVTSPTDSQTRSCIVACSNQYSSSRLRQASNMFLLAYNLAYDVALYTMRVFANLTPYKQHYPQKYRLHSLTSVLQAFRPGWFSVEACGKTFKTGNLSFPLKYRFWDFFTVGCYIDESPDLAYTVIPRQFQ